MIYCVVYFIMAGRPLLLGIVTTAPFAVHTHARRVDYCLDHVYRTAARDISQSQCGDMLSGPALSSLRIDGR